MQKSKQLHMWEKVRQSLLTFLVSIHFENVWIDWLVFNYISAISWREQNILLT